MISPMAIATSISCSLPLGQVIEMFRPSMSTLSMVHPMREVISDTTWRKFNSSFDTLLTPFLHFCSLTKREMHVSCHIFLKPQQLNSIWCRREEIQPAKGGQERIWVRSQCGTYSYGFSASCQRDFRACVDGRSPESGERLGQKTGMGVERAGVRRIVKNTQIRFVLGFIGWDSVLFDRKAALRAMAHKNERYHG